MSGSDRTRVEVEVLPRALVEKVAYIAGPASAAAQALRCADAGEHGPQPVFCRPVGGSSIIVTAALSGGVSVSDSIPSEAISERTHAKLVAIGQLRAATRALIDARDLLYAIEDSRAPQLADAVRLSMLTEQSLSDEAEISGED